MDKESFDNLVCEYICNKKEQLMLVVYHYDDPDDRYGSSSDCINIPANELTIISINSGGLFNSNNDTKVQVWPVNKKRKLNNDYMILYISQTALMGYLNDKLNRILNQTSADNKDTDMFTPY